jgi:hypothetical protein
LKIQYPNTASENSVPGYRNYRSNLSQAPLNKKMLKMLELQPDMTIENLGSECGITAIAFCVFSPQVLAFCVFSPQVPTPPPGATATSSVRHRAFATSEQSLMSLFWSPKAAALLLCYTLRC